PMSSSTLPSPFLRMLRRLTGAELEVDGDDTMLRHLERVAHASGSESLDLALSTLISLTGAQRGFIATRDGDGKLRIIVARAFSTLELDEPEAELSRSILETALADAGILVVEDASTDKRFSGSPSVQKLGLKA